MKKMLLNSVCISSLCAISSTLFAAPIATQHVLSERFNLCSTKAQGIIEQAACLSDEAELQNTRLDHAYTLLQSKLDQKQKADLAIAQRLWHSTRNSDSIFEATLFDQSQPENLQMQLNELQRIKFRADQLENYINIIN
ncbi:lysozyme inhibitor LprI family protein [Acinetobacter rudis]|uniref:lysozyme inhibitor LprI family protein n=1 Tax=Acinetobacter rudis TaxID=632955 RepID=UPI00280E2F93|nr:lysozyme inhibitor LprI family protein [Acinetobacter rudis]MDQ8952207.1 lysozyme inhibitor LprI family protein [Acinetobacter rudis]